MKKKNKDLTYLEKLKILCDGKLPDCFNLHMKYMEYKPNEKELCAENLFKGFMNYKEDLIKAKKLGLI